MLPSVKLNKNGSPGISRETPAWRSITLSLCENGAGEAPRYHEMVGTGLPEEKQVMLTESPSCTVTVLLRLMDVGAPACMRTVTVSMG